MQAGWLHEGVAAPRVCMKHSGLAAVVSWTRVWHQQQCHQQQCCRGCTCGAAGAPVENPLHGLFVGAATTTACEVDRGRVQLQTAMGVMAGSAPASFLFNNTQT
jgi:hypothetical protein